MCHHYIIGFCFFCCFLGKLQLSSQWLPFLKWLPNEHLPVKVNGLDFPTAAQLARPVLFLGTLFHLSWTTVGYSECILCVKWGWLRVAFFP